MLPASFLAVLCPDCPPAREARALVLEHEPWTHLLILVAPLIVVAAIVVGISRRAS